jgi:hypothetical protein
LQGQIIYIKKLKFCQEDFSELFHDKKTLINKVFLICAEQSWISELYNNRNYIKKTKILLQILSTNPIFPLQKV